MPRSLSAALAILLPLAAHSQPVPFDASQVHPGPVAVESRDGLAVVNWRDEAGRKWAASFSLDPREPLIRSIAANGAVVVERASPLYRCSTGTRRGGWDQFFDFPPSHPEGTRSFLARFHLRSASARSRGDRVEIDFSGLGLGIFHGALRYTFFPGTRLLMQEALVRTDQPDTAYIYDAGLRMAAPWAARPGGNMEADVSYYDTAGVFHSLPARSYSERIADRVRYRSLAVRAGAGAVAVFPAPHRYFFPRDYSTNMGYLWHAVWRGNISIGIRQLPDDNSPFYPWMNAPPGTEQHLGVFFLLGNGAPRAALDDVLRYTNRDRFEALPGYITFEPHWHFAYTVQAMARGFDWIPPFVPVLENLGVQSAMIMDFHGDGHPRDPGPVRLRELEAYYRACRARSGSRFLLIPAEEANVYLGGHWGVAFPKPVAWIMQRPAGTAFRTADPAFKAVYRVGSAAEMLDLVRAENGFLYQTHPRTKGSTGFPDEIRDTPQFQDEHYFGAGWKAMPADLSSPRLGERAFRTLDDMNNWGLRKRLIGEADLFQIDSTHELYAHMNVNYVRLPRLPSFDRYGALLDAVRDGRFFTTTGEVLLPALSLTPGPNGRISIHAEVRHRFPLEFAEVVWGEGAATHRRIFPIEATRQFTTSRFDWEVDAGNWRWARFAVWDVAANGAFVNPIWRDAAAPSPRAALPVKVVALDGWHNNEMHPHYRWEGTYSGGYSEAAKILASLGARTRTIAEPLTAASLSGVSFLLFPDPDTPAESPHPHYFTPAEIDALDDWVLHGGRLFLLGNDRGNAEFEHFNQLAARFGIEFLETTFHDSTGSGKLTLTGKPDDPVFGGLRFFAKDVAPLSISNPIAQVRLASGRTPILARVPHGRGAVYALGDPWFYNEYIDTADNRKILERLFREALR